MPRLTHILSLAGVAIAVSAQSASAQNAAMTEVYGEGVHRYYAGDYAKADELLSQVVNSGSQDPRAHYFRGLVRETQGMDGLFDFETGARLEAEGKRVVKIGQALIRVQGSLRGKIETARRAARIELTQQRLADKAARSSMVPSVNPSALPPTPAVTEDPFTGDGLSSTDKTPAIVDSKDDPFTEEAAPAGAVDAGGDLFDAVPAPVDATEDAAAAPAEDPFGADAGSDPFSGEDPFK